MRYEMSVVAPPIIEYSCEDVLILFTDITHFDVTYCS